MISFAECSARERLALIVDAGSFLGASTRALSSA